MIKFINHLTVQKWLFLLTFLGLNALFIWVWIIEPQQLCKNNKKSNVFQIPVKTDSNLCFSYEIIIFIYNILILLVLIFTFIASYFLNLSSQTLKWSNEKYIDDKTQEILIFIPCYSESKNEIELTLNSVIQNSYPYKKFFIVVDGIIKGKNNDNFTSEYVIQLLNPSNFYSIIYENIQCDVYTGIYKNTSFICIIKKQNYGKKHSFLMAHSFCEYFYNTENENKNSIDIHISISTPFDVLKNDNNQQLSFKSEYILILDTDTEISNISIDLLVNCLQKNNNIIGVCGETLVENKNKSIISMSQVYEYWVSHLTLKSIETYFSNVLVLSGCMSLYKTKYLLNNNLIQKYKGVNTEHLNIYNGNLQEIGEDRYLTSLLLTFYPDKKISYIYNAECKTNVPQNLQTLLSQRRRWTNSLFFCSVFLLKNTPNYDLKPKMIFICIVLFQLFLCLFFPMLITYSLYNFIIILTEPFNAVIFTQSILFLFSPTILCFLFGRLDMIPYSIPFILMVPIYSVIIPIYSFYYIDDFNWGKSREIEETQETS